MKILVAGGAGFVGAHLASSLLKDGHSVSVLDNVSRGQLDNLPEDVDHVWVGDCMDIDWAEFRGFDLLIDLAAIVYGVRDLYKDPAKLLRKNAETTIALLTMACELKIPRYLYVSSSCVYDFAGALVPHVETNLGPPETSYGWSKLFGEALCKYHAQEFGIDVRIVRLFNVFGPRDSFKSPHVIPDLLRKAWALKNDNAATMPIIGSGAQTRDFTWIADAVSGISAVAFTGQPGQAYNIGTGREISIREIAQLCCRTVGLDPEQVVFTSDPAPPEDIQRRAADITKITADTGWKPKVSLEDGVGRVWEWLRPQLERGRLEIPVEPMPIEAKDSAA